MARLYYSDVLALGFKEKISHDVVYFEMYGFAYSIVSKKIAKRRVLHWYKNTGKCKLFYLSKDHAVLRTKRLKTLEDVKHIINKYNARKR